MNYRVVNFAFAVICFGSIVWALQLRRENLRLNAELNELGRELQDAVQQLARYESERKSKAFFRTVDLLAAAGVPGLILLCAMALSGFSGAAAITVALASLGGPAGMLGGIGFLVTLGVVIARYGISDLSKAVIAKILERKSRAQTIAEIDALPRVIPKRFRDKAKAMMADL